MKRSTYSFILLLLVLGSSLITRTVPAASAGDTIYIRLDGSVDPASAPIVSAENWYYLVTEPIEGRLVVERNDVLIDGGDHVLQSGVLDYDGIGVLVEGRENVTVMRLGLQHFELGVLLSGSKSCQLIGNHFSDNQNGTRLVGSTNNTLYGNRFESVAFFGVLLDAGSRNNTLHFNHLAGGSAGLRIDETSYENTIVQNDILGTQSVILPFIVVEPNTWNTTYAKGGGNYWQYQCPGGDQYSGPSQDILGSDGVCDAWMHLENDGFGFVGYDYYPLVNPVADTHTIVYPLVPQLRISTRITITSNYNEYCLFDDVVISGVVTQVHDDAPLVGVTVTIKLKRYTTGGDSYSTLTATTGAEGMYTYVTSSTTPIELSMNASWAGNATHLGATSNSRTVTIADCASGPICFIATATYGSEMAPEVQFLRDFRADTVLTTFTGQQFMAVFNGIYYSFSPTVASGIASNEGLRTIARVVLYPLIRILQLGECVTQRFTVSPDLGIVAFVLVVSTLLSLVYIVPWALLLSAWRRFTVPVRVVRRGRDLLMGSVGLLLLAIALQMSLLTMVGGTLTVLLTTGLTTITVTRTIITRLITN